MSRTVLHTRGRWKFSLADIKKIFCRSGLWPCVSCGSLKRFPHTFTNGEQSSPITIRVSLHLCQPEGMNVCQNLVNVVKERPLNCSFLLYVAWKIDFPPTNRFEQYIIEKLLFRIAPFVECKRCPTLWKAINKPSRIASNWNELHESTE